jgi:Calcipressin
MATSLQSHEQSEPQIQHQQRQLESSPPTSATSSPKSVAHRRSASPLSLDLSNLPALSQPSPPSNTLLITQLNDPTIFHPASLATIRQHINSLAPLHSFSPLKSFRRIICSFYDTESAITIRQHLDGASLLGNVRTRVYFGEPTPIGEQKKYLDRPDAGRLFFISPPPSPPVGWEVREEDPPNKDVVASDLAEALVKLSGKLHSGDDATADETLGIDQDANAATAKPPLRVTAPPFSSSSDNTPASASTCKHSPAAGATSARNRSRSSTILYDPETHGDSPALPAVMVEDTTIDDMDVDGDEEVKAEAGEQKTILAHTSRPPVELMGDA